MRVGQAGKSIEIELLYEKKAIEKRERRK